MEFPTATAEEGHPPDVIRTPMLLYKLNGRALCIENFSWISYPNGVLDIYCLVLVGTRWVTQSYCPFSDLAVYLKWKSSKNLFSDPYSLSMPNDLTWKMYFEKIIAGRASFWLIHNLTQSPFFFLSFVDFV